MRGVSLMLRRLVAPCTTTAARSIGENIVLSSAVAAASYSTLILAEDGLRPYLLSSTAPFYDQGVFLNHRRNFFSSSPSSDSSKVVLIESEQHFNDSLRKVQDESLPAIFYFTAAWCAPCRLLSPVIVQLSEKYPHVTTYKVDIDKEGIGNTLRQLNITSVPTLHFFVDGKKASEMLGADAQLLKETMEELFK